MGHSPSNDTVAGIVVATAVGVAFLTFLVTYFLISRKRSSKSRRRHHRPSKVVSVPRKTRDHSVITEKLGASSLVEDYLPQSADDNIVERRARSTLEQIDRGEMAITDSKTACVISARSLSKLRI